jgi:hypothetical protein
MQHRMNEEQLVVLLNQCQYHNQLSICKDMYCTNVNANNVASTCLCPSLMFVLVLVG